MIAALLILVIIGTVGGAVVHFSSSNARSAEHSVSSSQARSLAEGGIASAMAIIAKPTSNRSDPSLVPQTVTSYAEGDVTWAEATTPRLPPGRSPRQLPSATRQVRRTSARPSPPRSGSPTSFTPPRRDPGDGTTDYEVWGMNSDGTGARPVTNNTVAERYPHWSSDGLTLVFSSELANDAAAGASSGSSGAAPNANRDIYTMNADGTNLKRLTTDAGFVNHSFSSDEEDPAWGPTGKIFFASLRNGHYVEVQPRPVHHEHGRLGVALDADEPVAAVGGLLVV